MFFCSTRMIVQASIVAAICAFVLYCFTLAPTIGWGDSADLALRMVTDIDKTFNNSRDYFLFHAIGKFFQLLPFGDAGTRTNSVAAFFGGVTVGLIAFISGILTRNLYAVIASAIALTVSHTFWFLSVTAEVYTFNTTLIFACYALCILWWQKNNIYYIFGAVFCAGLSLSHHVTGLIVAATLVPLILMRIRELSLRQIAILAILFIIGAFAYWERSAIHLQADIPFLYALSISSPSNFFFENSPLREMVKFIGYVGYNFLGFGFLLLCFGIVIAWRKRMWEMVPLILWVGVIAVTGITSSIPDKFNVYVLVYPVLAICVGLGISVLHQKKYSILLLASLALVPPLGYIAAIHTTDALGIDVVNARQVPYRDNNWYFMWPSKRGDVAPRQYATEALQAVDKNAILIADYTLWRPLYFIQAVEKMRPDVELIWVERLFWQGSIPHYINAQPCDKPIFLATNTPPHYYQLEEILKQYSITQVGVVYRVERRCLK